MSPELRQAYDLVDDDLRARGVRKLELLGPNDGPNYWRATIPEPTPEQWLLSQEASLAAAIDLPDRRTT